MPQYTFSVSGVSPRDRHMGEGFEDHLDMLFDGFGDEDEDEGGVVLASREVQLLHSLVVSVEADDKDEAEEKVEEEVDTTGITILNIEFLSSTEDE